LRQAPPTENAKSEGGAVMFTACAYREDGGLLLVFGLSDLNIEKLKEGKPMHISRKSHGMAIPDKMDIVIFTGKDEAEMRKALDSLIGPATIVDQKRPQ
jgi:hypothetical protein